MWDRIRRTLCTGSAFLLFFIGGAILSYVLLPIARLAGGTSSEKARRCRSWVGASWVFFHWYMRALNLVRYDPRVGRIALPKPPFVLVANHPTLVDVTAIVAMHADLAIVSKSAMFRSPLVGRLLRHCDHIQGGDGSAFSGAAVVEQAVARLRDGTSVLIFPEGTRSPERGLGEFHAGAFRIAARAGVPIVPLYLSCEPPTLMRGQPWYAIPPRPADLTIEPMPAILPPHRDPAATLVAVRAEYERRIPKDPRAAGLADAAAPANA